jgi:hypothetical protein
VNRCRDAAVCLAVAVWLAGCEILALPLHGVGSEIQKGLSARYSRRLSALDLKDLAQVGGSWIETDRNPSMATESAPAWADPRVCWELTIDGERGTLVWVARDGPSVLVTTGGGARVASGQLHVTVTEWTAALTRRGTGTARRLDGLLLPHGYYVVFRPGSCQSHAGS